MSDRRKREAETLTFSEQGPSIIGHNQQLIENCHGFLRRRHSGLTFSPPEEPATSVWMIDFGGESKTISVQAALADWKDWYASPGRQVISRFEQLRREFDEQHSRKRGVLALPPDAQLDFRSATLEDWEAENWDMDEDRVERMKNGSVEQFQQVLLERLAGQGIIEIKLVAEGELEILPESTEEP